MARIRNHLILLGLSVLVSAGWTAEPQAPASLPEGGTGIAARYPGDEGIGNHPAVVFAHDFEDASGPEDLRRRWDHVFHDGTLGVISDDPDVHSGKKAVEMTFPQRAGDAGNGLMKHLAKGYDTLFLRYYQKFDRKLDVRGAGSFHNGGSISSRYYAGGRSSPGERANGRNKFLVSYECTVYSEAPPPGNLTIYIYHPEQRGDYGDIFYFNGLVSPDTSLPGNFGGHFVPRRDVRPELDRWHCYEFMVQANTPGRRDGRIACWLEGKLVADFPNIRLRDSDSLKIDCLTIGGYIGPSKMRTNKIWFDDVVAATSYIGPRSQ